MEGVRIVALPKRTSHRFIRLVKGSLSVLRKVHAWNPDLCHFHDPELVPVGLVLKLLGHRVIYDVHEDLPLQIQNKAWIPRPLRPILSGITAAVEWVGTRFFDGIVAATPAIARRFPPEKTVVVQNFPEIGLGEARAAGDWDQRPFSFVYAGGISEMQGAIQMFEAFNQLPAGVHGVLAGWFVTGDLEGKLRSMEGWSRVEYLGNLDRPQVLATLPKARLGIVLDLPIPNYLEGYSTKMFEYMASGIPFVCSNFPLWVDIVGTHDCGIAVDPFDQDQIVRAMKRLIEDPEHARHLGENGRRAILESINWEHEFEKMAALYSRLLPSL